VTSKGPERVDERTLSCASGSAGALAGVIVPGADVEATVGVGSMLPARCSWCPPCSRPLGRRLATR